jgi:hypothetical protein
MADGRACDARVRAAGGAEFGVTIGVQNHHDIGCGFESRHEFIRAVGEPNCMALFDTWAPALHGAELAAAAALLEQSLFTPRSPIMRSCRGIAICTDRPCKHGSRPDPSASSYRQFTGEILVRRYSFLRPPLQSSEHITIWICRSRISVTERIRPRTESAVSHSGHHEQSVEILDIARRTIPRMGDLFEERPDAVVVLD